MFDVGWLLRFYSGVVTLLHPSNQLDLTLFIMGLLHITNHLFKPAFDYFAAFIALAMCSFTIVVFVGLA